MQNIKGVSLLILLLLWQACFVMAQVSPVILDTAKAGFFFGENNLLFESKYPDVGISDMAGKDFLPLRYSDTIQHNNFFLLGAGNQNSRWIYAEFKNNLLQPITKYFYFSHYINISFYQYDVATGRIKSENIEEYLRDVAANFAFPVTFPPLSTSRVWFKMDDANTPVYKEIYFVCAGDAKEVSAFKTSATASQIGLWIGLFPTFICLGCLLSMLIFSFVYFLQTREVVFIYYFAYLLLTFLYFFHRITVANSISTWLYYIEPFRDITWQCGSYLFYFLFAREFAEFKIIAPRLDRLVKWCVIFVGIYLCCDFLLHFTHHYYLRGKAYSFFRLFMMLPAVISISWTARLKHPVAKYLAAGSACMVLGAFVAFVWSAIYHHFHFYLLIYSMNFMTVGIILEIIFFTFGLSYKTKLKEQEKIRVEMELKSVKELKELEHLQTVVETQNSERKRVSRELHDDLGAGLSTIRFLSEVGKTREDTKTEMAKISALSSDLVDSMRQIIWTMNPENSLWDDMIQYLKRYSAEYLESHMIELKFSVRVRVRSQNPISSISP